MPLTKENKRKYGMNRDNRRIWKIVFNEDHKIKKMISRDSSVCKDICDNYDTYRCDDFDRYRCIFLHNVINQIQEGTM